MTRVIAILFVILVLLGLAVGASKGSLYNLKGQVEVIDILQNVYSNPGQAIFFKSTGGEYYILGIQKMGTIYTNFIYLDKMGRIISSVQEQPNTEFSARMVNMQWLKISFEALPATIGATLQSVGTSTVLQFFPTLLVVPMGVFDESLYDSMNT